MLKKCALAARKFKFYIVLALLIPGGLIFLPQSTYFTHLPSSKKPLIFYSKQSHGNLLPILIKALRKAKQNITIYTYQLSDPTILTELKKALKKNISVTLWVDAKTFSKTTPLSHPLFHCNKVKMQGLMHEKIFCIDECILFLGSTNLTRSSLSLHFNDLVGFYNPLFAKNVLKQKSFSFDNYSFFQLPDPKALEPLLKRIKQAQKSIDLFMFTLTHPKIIHALIESKKRGVDVKIFLDRYTIKNASRKAFQSLEEANIPLYHQTNSSLLHHKFARIDDVLIFGSANWTKSAFNKNKDYFFIINNTKNNNFIKKIKRSFVLVD